MERNKIKLNSYAKINLSLDVGRPLASGMHPVDMIMQQISLCDEVVIEVSKEVAKEASGADSCIALTCSNSELPTDNTNLAYRAAELMLEAHRSGLEPDLKEKTLDERALVKPGIRIHIEKRIPLAAGLAGGSSNAAAVIIGLNYLLDLGYSLDELCALGAKLGSDVPFCIMGQMNDSMASTAARATGTGTDLKPCAPLDAYVLIAKPRIGVSTKEVYQGIDAVAPSDIEARPKNEEFERALSALKEATTNNDCSDQREEQLRVIGRNSINVLELYTLKAYPEVARLKEQIKNACKVADANPISVLMSGSGPTVYALFTDEADAIKIAENLRNAFPNPDECFIATCETI